jgi:RNAse (barnase) inhibitor barstar
MRPVILELDATRWTNADDVWTAVLDALGAPDWHGRNLDALADSLTGVDLNVVNPPFTLRVSGFGLAGRAAQTEAQRLATLFDSLSQDGVPVAWTLV